MIKAMTSIQDYIYMTYHVWYKEWMFSSESFPSLYFKERSCKIQFKLIVFFFIKSIQALTCELFDVRLLWVFRENFQIITGLRCSHQTVKKSQMSIVYRWYVV